MVPKASDGWAHVPVGASYQDASPVCCRGGRVVVVVVVTRRLTVVAVALWTARTRWTVVVVTRTVVVVGASGGGGASMGTESERGGRARPRRSANSAAVGRSVRTTLVVPWCVREARSGTHSKA